MRTDKAALGMGDRSVLTTDHHPTRTGVANYSYLGLNGNK